MTKGGVIMASGIAEYMLGRNIDSRQYEETHIMENIIYNELLIKGYNVDVGMVEYNYCKGWSYTL